MRINEANHQSRIKNKGGYRAWVAELLRMRWGLLQAIEWSTTVGETQAYILRSNWVADCPFCSSTSIVQLDEPFFCPDCGMQGNKSKPATLRAPQDRVQIEAALLKRPDPITRNWLVNETAADLFRENREHGIGEK